MDVCRGCGAFMMPDWETCKICGFDPAAPVVAVEEADGAKKRGRRARKAGKAAAAAPTPAPAPAEPVVAPPARAEVPAEPLPPPRPDLLAAPATPATARRPATVDEGDDDGFAALRATMPEPEPPPPRPWSRRTKPEIDDDEDDDAYEDFEPNRVPMILLVILIVVLVGYFGIYLPTREDGNDRLVDLPGLDDDRDDGPDVGSVEDGAGLPDPVSQVVSVTLAEHDDGGVATQV